MRDDSCLEADIAAVAALKDPVRRALYRYTVAQPQEVGRDQAAEALNLTRAVAAFHLDRLVAEGLLEATYRRTSGRGGPGAGRPAKFYRQSRRQVRLSFPPQNYELAARLLQQAFRGPSSRDQKRALRDSRKLGASLGRHALDQADRPRGSAARMKALEALLEAKGFQPTWRDKRLDLANCPFVALVDDCPDLICRANLGLMEGILRGLELQHVKVVLECQPDRCCVFFVVLPRAKGTIPGRLK